MRSILLVPVVALALTGCIARTAVDIVTLPVKAASKGVDMATTSQSEADEKRGRALRQHEERLGKLERKQAKAQRDCRDGDREACDKAEDLGRAIEDERDSRY